MDDYVDMIGDLNDINRIERAAYALHRNPNRWDRNRTKNNIKDL